VLPRLARDKHRESTQNVTLVLLQVVKILPTFLREELIRTMYKDVIETCPLFENNDGSQALAPEEVAEVCLR